MVILNVDHPDIIDFIECKAKEEAKAFSLIKAGYDGSGPDSEAYSSIFFQNANNSVRVSDEFMRAYETRRRLHHLHRQGPRARQDLQGARHHAQDCRVHLALRRSRHAVRHHHQQVAHQQEHGAHQRLQSLLASTCSSTTRPATWPASTCSSSLTPAGTFDIAAYRHAISVIITAMEILVDNSGYPTEAIATQLARLPPARPRLRQPGRAAHGLRSAL